MYTFHEVRVSGASGLQIQHKYPYTKDLFEMSKVIFELQHSI